MTRGGGGTPNVEESHPCWRSRSGTSFSLASTPGANQTQGPSQTLKRQKRNGCKTCHIETWAPQVGASTYTCLGSSEPTDGSRGKTRQREASMLSWVARIRKKKSKQAFPECNSLECNCGAHIHIVSSEGLFDIVKQVLLLCFEIIRQFLVHRARYAPGLVPYWIPRVGRYSLGGERICCRPEVVVGIVEASSEHIVCVSLLRQSGHTILVLKFLCMA